MTFLNQVASQTESEAESEVELKEEKPASTEAPVQQENLVSSTTSPGTVLDLSDLYPLEPDESMETINLKEIGLDPNGLKQEVTIQKVESSAKDEGRVDNMKAESKQDLAASEGLTFPGVAEAIDGSKQEVKVDSSGLNGISMQDTAPDVAQASGVGVEAGHIGQVVPGDEKVTEVVPSIPQPIAVVNDTTPVVQLDTSGTIQDASGAIQVPAASTIQVSESPQVIQVSQSGQTVSLFSNVTTMSQDTVQPGPSHDPSYTSEPSVFRKDPPQSKEQKTIKVLPGDVVKFIPDGGETFTVEKRPIPFKQTPRGRPKISPDDEYGESYVEDSSGNVKLNLW